MGEVYQARDLRLGRIVALKLFNTDHEPTVRDHARLREEASDGRSRPCAHMRLTTSQITAGARFS